MPAGIRHRRLTKGSIDVPISQFHVIEHKIGFKPIIACSCDAVLDLNKSTLSKNKAFFAEHELCPPKVTRDVEVVREDAGLSQE